MKIPRQGGYDAITVTHAQPIIPAPGETAKQATVRGLVAAWRNLPDVPIVAIRDNPWATGDVLSCVAQHRNTAAQVCAVSRSQGLAIFDGQAEAARQLPRAHLVVAATTRNSRDLTASQKAPLTRERSGVRAWVWPMQLSCPPPGSFDPPYDFS